MLFSNPGPKYTQSSNRLNNGEKLIIASSVIKVVYIRPCISLIRHYMSKVWFIYLYFSCWKRSFLIKICGRKDFMFRYDKFPGFGVSLIFFWNISKIRLLIQITLSRNARIQMDLSKNNRFSHQEATNYIPRIEKRKKGTSIWNTWVLWVFVLPHVSNFIMETEDNSKQRQLYDSSII